MAGAFVCLVAATMRHWASRRPERARSDVTVVRRLHRTHSPDPTHPDHGDASGERKASAPMASKPSNTTDSKRGPLAWGRMPVEPATRPWVLAAGTLTSVAVVIAASLGPWLTIERGPADARDVVELSGVRTDGVFSLAFALIAGAAVGLALLRPTWWVLGWVACVAMVICSLVGLFDWVFFSPMVLAAEQRGEVIAVEWGLKMLTYAAPVGALGTFLIARRLMTDAT